MKDFSNLPFIDISAENLDMAYDMLDREEMGELMEMIIKTIRLNEEPTTNNKVVRGVYNQFMSVISRKSEGFFKRKEALDKVNAERKTKKETEQPVPTCDISNDEKEKAKEEVKKETKVYKLPANLKVDEKDGHFQEWLLMMKNNPEDKKTFSRWWQFYRNKDDAADDLNNRFQIEVKYA